MKIDGRGKHGKQGRKKLADPRKKNINIRVNTKEHSEIIKFFNEIKMSQTNAILYLIRKFKGAKNE